MPTLRDKVCDKVCASATFSDTSVRSLSPTCPESCHRRNSIRATQTDLPQTCHALCRNHLDISRWFKIESPKLLRDIPVSLFVSGICMVRDCQKVRVKVGVMKFELYSPQRPPQTNKSDDRLTINCKWLKTQIVETKIKQKYRMQLITST